jgi:type IV pilus assembly protein PilC
MSNYLYEAIDAGGLKTEGVLEVADQFEALRRIKEMGLFPVKIAEARRRPRPSAVLTRARLSSGIWTMRFARGKARIRSGALVVFTRQLATLLGAGVPLLRSLRLLEEQAETNPLQRIIGELATSIESGGTLSEGMCGFPKAFSPLYVNMIRAGELGGALEVVLNRLADFMEKAQKIKGKIKAAMFYPSAVLVVASAIMMLLMGFVIPRFQEVFTGLLEGAALPAFTRFVFGVSAAIQHHLLAAVIVPGAAFLVFNGVIRTNWGRRAFDWLKLSVPLFGPVFRKTAIARFARTLGTLLQSGVPILQALSIVKDTAGNVVVSRVIGNIHESVKQGDTISVPLKASHVFPAMVAGMIEVGEQTGALPDLLMKIGDTYEDEVDNAVGAMTSLLEPIMIVLLAVIVGSIVIAMFLPLIRITGSFDTHP